jgi:VirE N-terminal domain
MSWANKQVSLYSSHADNAGRSIAIGEILLSEFGISRELYGRRANDLETLIELRALDRSAIDYQSRKLTLKSSLQCFTPAALLLTKEKGNMTELSRSGLLQLDFDYQDIQDFDLQELKQCVFTLPWVAFCGLSCSGDGFYALVCIAEPDRLADYAEHLFLVLEGYGIKADTSKGKKVENLRYVSYDCNMLIRDNPEILRIKNFQTKPAPKKQMKVSYAKTVDVGANPFIQSQLTKIQQATVGSRWQTVQQAAFTLGGLGDQSLLYAIKSEIEANPEFNGQEEKYRKCADDCFEAGKLKPLNGDKMTTHNTLSG